MATHTLLWAVLLQAIVVSGQEVARADFNMAGLTGNVLFEDSGRQRVRMTVNIRTIRWFLPEIREFPVITTEGHLCNDLMLGNTTYDLRRALNVIDGRTRQGRTVFLNGVSLTSGPISILGRSLLLWNGQERACATIQGSESVSYAVVNGHIAGHIHVRAAGTRYAVFTDLIKTNSLSPTTATLKVYMGEIYSDQPQAEKEVIPASNRCVDSRVSSTTMVTELRRVPVSGGDGISRFMQYISLNPSSGQFNFTSGWVKVEDATDTSCANFHEYEMKKVKAVFNREGVQGVITFSQENPYKSTQVNVDLQNLEGQAGGYHIYQNPLPYEFNDQTDLCAPENTGERWNPFNGLSSGRTQDQLEVGDLSAKHGSLNRRFDINETYTDLYLPLFGKYSIVGRSVVIRRQRDDSTWVCANIGYPGPATVAKAEFNGDVEGTITLVQQKNMPWGDTSVFVMMTDAGRTNETTLDHTYHINMNPVGDDFLATGSRRCSSTGGHWNPYNVATGDSRVYRQSCEINRLACEVGDLSGRYGETINITASPASTKYFYTDDLPLSGAYSIIRKSIVIDEKAQAPGKYVCADIMEKLTPAVTTERPWNGSSRIGGVTGSIKMTSTGLSSSPTQLSVDLQGLQRKADSYRINVYPLNKQNPGNNVCSTTGDLYNPLGASGWRTGDSQDAFAIGDLSNKFGMLSNRNIYQLEATDVNLPLNGANSVVGRSVVINEGATGWKCTNTVWDTAAMNATLLQARAHFKGAVEGHIKFSQMVSRDGESDVNMEVILWYTDSSKPATVNHNWHVHLYSIANSDCSSASGHYNPFAKSVGSASYGAECSVETPRKCELGDLSGKLGKINIGTRTRPTRYVFNDNFLSLTGMFSVMGKSILIHTQNSGASSVACADIAPFGDATQVVKYYIEAPSDISKLKENLGTSIEKQVGMDIDHNVYVGIGEKLGWCIEVSIHFTGERAEQMKRQFNAARIFNYKPVDVNKCTTGSTSSGSPGGSTGGISGASSSGATIPTLPALTLLMTSLAAAYIPQ